MEYPTQTMRSWLRFRTGLRVLPLLVVVLLQLGCAPCWVPFVGSKPEFQQSTLDSLTAQRGSIPDAFAALKQSPPDSLPITSLRQRSSTQLEIERGRSCNGGVVGSLKEATEWLRQFKDAAMQRQNPTLVDEGRLTAEKLFDKAIRAENNKKK